MRNQFKLLTLITFSCLIIYSCQKNIDNETISPDMEIAEINYRYDEADPVPVEECSSTGEKEQTVDLTDKNLKRGRDESIEDFLTRLGYTQSLCAGECEGDLKCKIVKITSSSKDEIHTWSGAHTGRLYYITVDDSNQDISKVKIILSATCDCL